MKNKNANHWISNRLLKLKEEIAKILEVSFLYFVRNIIEKYGSQVKYICIKPLDNFIDNFI